MCRSDGENEYETEAEAALEEMDDAEMEERELEETEDLLEYYLQRAANTQSEAERLLAGARDLEESIGVSLSARRFEVRCAALAARRACLCIQSSRPPGLAPTPLRHVTEQSQEPCNLAPVSHWGHPRLPAPCADRLPHACAQVNRLELTLSIGSFSAALGAMVAGIFGMNLRSTLEDSIIGFWGTTAGIVLCCFWVFYALYSYTRRRRIL